MRFRMASRMPIEAAELWDWLARPAMFQQVSAPLMAFQLNGKSRFPERWAAGETYRMTMRLGGFIPLGRHQIHFAAIDSQQMRIRTDETGSLIRSWKHTMEVRINPQGETCFHEELEIHNGLLTWCTYAGAYLFFLYRHWKIRRLAKRAQKIK